MILSLTLLKSYTAHREILHIYSVFNCKLFSWTQSLAGMAELEMYVTGD